MRFFKRSEAEEATGIDLPDQWQVYESEHDGQPLIARFNEGARAIAGKPTYKIEIGVAVPFNAANESGMPSDEDLAQLETFEETLIEKAAPRAILVGVITTGGMREFVLYTGSTGWIEAFHGELSAALPSHDVQVMAQEDKSWDVYRSFVAD